MRIYPKTTYKIGRIRCNKCTAYYHGNRCVAEVRPDDQYCGKYAARIYGEYNTRKDNLTKEDCIKWVETEVIIALGRWDLVAEFVDAGD